MSHDIKSDLLVKKKGRIAYVTLNRPEVLNALTTAHWEQLTDTWQALDDDPDVWVIIITGAGEKSFSTGQDLKDLASGGSSFGGTGSVESESTSLKLHELDFDTPAIAAINGFCIAGGLEIALSCDIRVAAEHSQFGLAEVRWGIMPSGGGVDRLPRSVPLCIAMEMLLTAQRIDAQEAYRIGLINRVVSAADVIAEAEDVAEKICQNGPLAVRVIKENVYRGYNLSLQQAFRFERAFSSLLSTTEDAVEGPLAFSEKRQPKFKGR